MLIKLPEQFIDHYIQYLEIKTLNNKSEKYITCKIVAISSPTMIDVETNHDYKGFMHLFIYGASCNLYDCTENIFYECRIDDAIHANKFHRFRLKISNPALSLKKGNKVILYLMDNFTELYKLQKEKLESYKKQISDPNIPIENSNFSRYFNVFSYYDRSKEEKEDNLPNVKWCEILKGLEKKKSEIEQNKSAGMDDPFQQNAIEKIVDKVLKEEESLSLIWGPPGTGKTQVIYELCEKIALQNNKKVLVTSFTNVAVDNALERIIDKTKGNKNKIVRHGSINKVSVKSVRKYCNDGALSLNDKNIIGATLDSLLTKIWDDKFFDVIIIDEASMVHLPKIVNASVKTKHLILVGDFLQLHPFDDLTALNLENNKDMEKYKKCSIFSYFSYLCLKELDKIKNMPSATSNLYPLLNNRRSYPGLMQYANENFYSNLLNFSKEKRYPKIIDKKFPEGIEEIFYNNTDKPVWLDPESFKKNVDGGIKPIQIRNHIVREKPTKPVTNTFANLGQLAITIILIKKVLELYYKNRITDIKKIGVISIFNFQIEVFKRWLWEYGNQFYGESIEESCRKLKSEDKISEQINNLLDIYYKEWVIKNIEIGTVEKFQGREKDFLITNTIINPMNERKQIHIALRDFKKLNVIISRAKENHIIISDNYNRIENKDIDIIHFLNDNIEKNYKYIYRPVKGYYNHITDTEETLKKLIYFDEKLKDKFSGELAECIEDLTGGGKIEVSSQGGLKIKKKDYQIKDTTLWISKKRNNILEEIAEKLFINHSSNSMNSDDKNKIIVGALEDILKSILDKIYSYYELSIEEDPKNIYSLGKKFSDTIKKFSEKIFFLSIEQCEFIKNLDKMESYRKQRDDLLNTIKEFLEDGK